jgi:hypothetical protein
MMFALTGLSAGSHTFAVQGRDRQGDGRVDTDDVRTLQIVEIESGASLLVDLLTTVANDAPASWANMTNLSDTQTPGAGSVLIWNMTVQMLDSGAADKAAEYRFAVDGTRIGPHLSDRNDQANKVDGVSMAWAADGVPASSHTFSVQWQELLSTPDMDTARERIFQVIEISADADLLIDVSSTSSQGATGSYSDQLPMGGQPDIDSIDSIPLVLWNWNMDASASSDAVAKVRLEIAGTQEGAQLPIFKDGVDQVPGCLMVRAISGQSGVTDFIGQWIEINGTVETDTTKPRTFQVIDLKVGGVTHTASGAPSITKPTSAGTAIRKVTATGTPEITKPTSAGTAIRKITADGAPEITKPTAVGTAIRKITAVGNPIIAKPTATGSAIRKITASGAPSITNLISTGEAVHLGKHTASGAPSITKPTANGTARRIVKASGSPSITKPTAQGQGNTAIIIPPGTDARKFREEQYRDRLETEDEEILAIVIAATTAIINDLD